MVSLDPPRVADKDVAHGYQALRADGWRRTIFIRLFVTDLVLVICSVLVAMVARFGVPKDVDSWGPTSVSYEMVSLMVVVAWMVALAMYQAYHPSLLGVGLDEYRIVIRATAAVFGLFAIFSMAFKFDYSRGYFAIALPLGAVSLMAGRLVNRQRLVAWRRSGRAADGALVVGNPVEVRHVAEGVARRPASGYRVLAVATDGPEGEFELESGEKVVDLGSIEALPQKISSLGYGCVIIAGQSLVNRALMRRFGWAMEDGHQNLVVASVMTDVAGPRIHWRPIEGLPLMSVELPRFSGLKFAAKRVFDVVLSAVLLLALSPVLIATALAIKVDSRGPVFFRHRRIGVQGNPFKMTKFRSMVDGADKRFDELSARFNEGNDVQFKLHDDPRVTRVGKFIRKTSIDELPQLFDVLIGTMSLVGPRPHVQKEVDQYADHVRRRLYVKPGITGPWQVGGRSNLSWGESIRKDLSYVENWSLSGDVLILFRTVKAVLSKDGAY